MPYYEYERSVIYSETLWVPADNRDEADEIVAADPRKYIDDAGPKYIDDHTAATKPVFVAVHDD
jgi:hypothetical protein